MVSISAETRFDWTQDGFTVDLKVTDLMPLGGIKVWDYVFQAPGLDVPLRGPIATTLEADGETALVYALRFIQIDPRGNEALAGDLPFYAASQLRWYDSAEYVVFSDVVDVIKAAHHG